VVVNREVLVRFLAATENFLLSKTTKIALWENTAFYPMDVSPSNEATGTWTGPLSSIYWRDDKPPLPHTPS